MSTDEKMETASILMRSVAHPQRIASRRRCGLSPRRSRIPRATRTKTAVSSAFTASSADRLARQRAKYLSLKTPLASPVGVFPFEPGQIVSLVQSMGIP